MFKSKHHIDFYLIGISNKSKLTFTEDVQQIIAENIVFSGGKRHYALVKNLFGVVVYKEFFYINGFG